MDFNVSTRVSALQNQGPNASVTDLLFAVSLGICVAILKICKG